MNWIRCTKCLRCGAVYAVEDPEKRKRCRHCGQPGTAPYWYDFMLEDDETSDCITIAAGWWDEDEKEGEKCD